MTPATILLVEDNPITRKLVRFALENQGLVVIEAPDGRSALDAFPQHRVELVLQDMCLPDIDGFELVSRLRASPGGSDIPILVFSGMLSHYDEARVSSAGFDELISKPVEPSRLVQIIRSYLPSAEPTPLELLGKGRRVLVVDDDPVQRRLVSFRVQKVGFDVSLAGDGHDALEQARRERPDAILSDVLMPGLDGFGLCLEVRRDPVLSKIPIVLTTNSYIEPNDRELARKAGAYDLVLRTPELREVLEALHASFGTEPTPVENGTRIDELEDEHLRRMMCQLERQVALNAGVNRRCALLAAEMSVLKGISDALAGNEDIDEALRHTLAACFDAGGISLGALYLKENEGLRVLCFGLSRDWSESELLSFFGERALLEAAIDKQQSTLLLRSDPSLEKRRMLARAEVDSALIVPIARRDVSYGALVMLSKNDELQQDDRVEFCEAVAGQISQAIAVTHAFRERERSERVARQQAAILRSVLESIGDGVGVVDSNGNFILSNSAAADMVKFGPRNNSLRMVSGNAGIFDTDMVTPMPFDRLPLVRAMRGEAIDGVEMFVRHDSAQEGVWLSASGRPWRDDHGVARGGVVVFRDVTREKATQSQLMVSDRMASVGLLAAGVAHEINNPLAAVLANLDLAHREILERAEASGDIQDLGEMVEDARAAAARVRQIVRDLRIFSRHEEVVSGPVDVRRVLESCLRMAWNEIRHRSRLLKDYGDVGQVEGTESRLGQVFLNLIVNAAQAIPEGSAEENVIRVATRRDGSGRIAVEISDTGSGIPPESLSRLFTPFFTTKPAGVGTGLGLAICQRIVRELGGEIEVETELGRGTTFRVLLIPTKAAAVEDEGRTAQAPEAPRRARILVIDDEPLIGRVVRRALGAEHDIVATMQASDGLERIRGGESFDVILCDLMMPQMSGMEFFAELSKLDAEHADRVIFLTGGAFTPAARAFLDKVQNQRVEKPFDPQHLRVLMNDRIK